jgi:general stress protein YciG
MAQTNKNKGKSTPSRNTGKNGGVHTTKIYLMPDSDEEKPDKERMQMINEKGGAIEESDHQYGKDSNEREPLREWEDDIATKRMNQLKEIREGKRQRSRDR